MDKLLYYCYTKQEQKHITMTNITTHLTEEQYQLLPSLLGNLCLDYQHPTDRLSLLLMLLNIAGNVSNRYHGTYQGNSIYPNLHTCIIHPKGKLPAPLHTAWTVALYADNTLLKYYEQDKENYPNELKFHEAEMRDYRNGILDTRPEDPPPPMNYQYLTPSTTEHMPLVQLLISRHGRIMLHHLEDEPINGYALTKLLHKGFYNLPYQQYVIASQKNLHVAQLKVSLLLAGDYDRLQQLIPNTDSLLYPACHYIIANHMDDNPFAQPSINQEACKKYGDEIMDINNELLYNHARQFALQEAEQTLFVNTLCQGNYTTQEAMTCYRIAMLLCLLQEYETNRLNNKEVYLYATTEQLQLSIAIIDTLKAHRREVAQYLTTHPKELELPAAPMTNYTEEQLQVAHLHEQGTSLRKIASTMYGDEQKFMKVKRMLTTMGLV